MVGNVFCDNRAGTDEGITAYCMATNDSAVGTECCSFFYEGGADLVHFADFRPWIINVGENHGRPTKNAVFQDNAFIGADVVLDFAFVADNCVGSDDDILADVAVFTNFGAG